MASSSTWTDRSRARLRLDFTPTFRPPEASRLVLATAISIGASLLADAALVFIGTRVFPSTKGYVHFEFHDYARLTIIGIVIACAAWPVMARVTSAPRWLFFRLVIAVTAVLLLPDLYILWKGQPAEAVCVLIVMHLAIAVITYNALVRLAPMRSRRRTPG
jgi:hypothetical protein